MATYTKPAQFIIRVEFHGAGEEPSIYSIFHAELAENIFHDQYYNSDTNGFYDLPRATYFTQGSFRKQDVLKHAQDVVDTTIKLASRKHNEIEVTADIYVIEGAEPYPFLTNTPPVARRERLK